MGRYALERAAMAIPFVLLVSCITFVIMDLLPGDPALAALGGQMASGEAVEELRRQLGLDDPVYVRYWRFLGGALRGDFGRSLRTKAPVSDEILTTLPATARLAAGGLAVAVVLGVPLGVAAALKRDT